MYLQVHLLSANWKVMDQRKSSLDKIKNMFDFNESWKKRNKIQSFFTLSCVMSPGIGCICYYVDVFWDIGVQF